MTARAQSGNLLEPDRLDLIVEYEKLLAVIKVGRSTADLFMGWCNFNIVG